MLVRTRKMFRLVRRDSAKGRTRIVVLADGHNREGSLHHSCQVKPALRLQ